MTYEELLNISETENLIVKEKNIPGYGGRIYKNRIAIHQGIDTSIEKACVLAEELGHYYTTVGDILDQSKKRVYDHYLDYVTSSKSTVFEEDKQKIVDLFTQKSKGPIIFREHQRSSTIRRKLSIICNRSKTSVVFIINTDIFRVCSNS